MKNVISGHEQQCEQLEFDKEPKIKLTNCKSTKALSALNVVTCIISDFFLIQLLKNRYLLSFMSHYDDAMR